MSTQRLATSVFSSPQLAARAAQTSQRHTRQVCFRCLRPFPTQRAYFPASKRRSYVSPTLYRPQDLATHQAPARNAGVPETSIAGGQPDVDFPRHQLQQDSDASSSSGGPDPTISIPESEAQQPQPGPAVGSVATESVSSTTKATPQRKSKLRPRKAAMTLTPTAVAQLRSILNQPEPKMIRVGVKNRGCSGLAYHLEYVDKPGAFDEAVDQDGVKVLVDSKALFSIIGSEMDWVEDKLNQRFVFNNPNIKEQCGCGESFSVG